MDKQLIVKNNLWHYTTIDGLMGILESQHLWATDYRHLNDSSELIYALIILEKNLLPKVILIVQKEYDKSVEAKRKIDQNGGVECIAGETTKDIIGLLRKALLEMGPLFTVPCISSFCLGEIKDEYIQRDGLLSQWRGYGSDGGYAVVFNLSELLKCFKKECEDFRYATSGDGDACYDCNALDKQHDLFNHLNRITKFASELYFSRLYNTKMPKAAQYLESLVYCLARFKHPGFEEEREYRFFVFAYNDEEAVKKEDVKKNTPLEERNKPLKKIKNRWRQGTSVPYVELFETIPRLPIERIVVGPHKDKERRTESLKIQLKSQGLHDIKVGYSDIPYIGLSH